MPLALIREAATGDAGDIVKIYNHYITHSVATFEEEPLTSQGMASRIMEVQASGLPWLVAERDGRVIGYAYAGKWKGRCAYRHSVESTVYVEPETRGRNIGTGLYERLLEELRERSIHTVIGGIALPNPASIALHERLGFSKIAHFREVGFKFDRWIDVGYWQAILADGVLEDRPRPAT